MKREGEQELLSSSSYLTDVGAFGLGGPGDDAGDGEARLAGVDKVGGVHLASQRLDVSKDGDLHLQVWRLRLIHDETHQDVELLLVRERLSAGEETGNTIRPFKVSKIIRNSQWKSDLVTSRAFCTLAWTEPSRSAPIFLSS